MTRYFVLVPAILAFGIAGVAGGLPRSDDAGDGSSARNADDGNIGIGASISRPELMSGAWETRLASGEILGLSLELQTTVDGAPTALEGTEQQIRFIRIVTYLRIEGRTNRTMWYATLPGDFHWQRNHLQLHAAGTDLDLVFDPLASRWAGTVKRLDFSGPVVLDRPSDTLPRAPTGVWKSSPNTNQFGCIHVAMGNDRRLVLWMDYINLSGLARYATGQTPPPRADETYGELLQDPKEEPVGGLWRFDLTNGLWGTHVAGEVDGEGRRFSGEETKFGNGYYLPGNPDSPLVWQREPGSSCTVSP
jgi:hypothetical protein